MDPQQPLRHILTPNNSPRTHTRTDSTGPRLLKHLFLSRVSRIKASVLLVAQHDGFHSDIVYGLQAF